MCPPPPSNLASSLAHSLFRTLSLSLSLSCLSLDTQGLNTWQRDLGVVTQPTTRVSRKSPSFRVQAAERRPRRHPLAESGSSLNSRHPPVGAAAATGRAVDPLCVVAACVQQFFFHIRVQDGTTQRARAATALV